MLDKDKGALMKKLIYLFLCIFLASCGDKDLKQDPCVGLSDEVCNPIPLEEEPEEKLDGIARNSIVINPLSRINLYEEEEAIVDVTARVVNQTFKYDISIENLPKDAIFDPSTNQIKWTPPKNWVGEKFWYKSHKIKVLVSTRTTPALTVEEEHIFFVHKMSSKPEVLKIELERRMNEGEAQEILITVKDDSSIANSSIKPGLMAVRTKAGAADGSSFIEILYDRSREPNPVQDDTDPSIWYYKARIDLGDLEITKTRISKYFGFMAFNAMGVPSVVRSSRVLVQNVIKKPKVTWESGNAIFMEVGDMFTYSFTAFEPSGSSDHYGSGEVKVECVNCGNFPDVKLKCLFAWSVGRQTCTLSVNATKPSNILLNFRVTVKDPRSSTEHKLDFRRRFIIKSPPPPPTTPNPVPTGGNL